MRRARSLKMRVKLLKDFACLLIWNIYTHMKRGGAGGV